MSGKIAAALAKAQAGMAKAEKGANNPHFRKSYAALGNVMDACMPALNSNGIAVVQPAGEDEHGRYVDTILIHGESGEQLSCRVPLIVQKNDMQGYGSAVTYARRYGLMAMAGIAPEDDDGNAAAAAAPKRKPEPKRQEPKTEEPNPQAIAKWLSDAIAATKTKDELDAFIADDNAKHNKAWKWLCENAEPEAKAVDEVLQMKRAAFENFKPSSQVDGDHIPY